MFDWLTTAVKPGESFTVKKLTSRNGCTWGRTTLYDFVKPLAEAGVLADAGMEGRSCLYRLAGSLPGAGVTWLPTVSELEAKQ